MLSTESLSVVVLKNAAAAAAVKRGRRRGIWCTAGRRGEEVERREGRRTRAAAIVCMGQRLAGSFFLVPQD